MPGEQEQVVEANEVVEEENSKKERFEIFKWILIFIVAIFVPLVSLVVFWSALKPPFEVFATISVLYLVCTLLLLKPLTMNKSNNDKLKN